MSHGQGELDDIRGSAQSGLRRLTLKLPARERLKTVGVGNPSEFLRELFLAYDEACLALNDFRRENDHHPLVAEYEAVCGELEADVIRELARRS